MKRSIDRLRVAWWWISDADWRNRYAANRRRLQRFQTGQRNAVERLLKKFGSKVLAGPFVGMSFSHAHRPNAYCAQVLLGTYELEIHPTIEAICRAPYSLMIDIGADRGYYVCGFKRRRPDVRVVAFESEVAKHPTIRSLMRENGLDGDGGVTIYGQCHSGALQQQLRDEPRPFVLCDIDGAEVEVLDPRAVPALARADILVETHDGLRPGITELLIDRFSSTHRVEVLPERPRALADAPAGMPLSDTELVGAMDEFRGFPQSWLWMVAESH